MWLCGLALLIIAVRCASESGVDQGSMSSESGGVVWCGGVAADLTAMPFALWLTDAVCCRMVKPH